MAIEIRVGSITDEIGTPTVLHAFFSTISAHCDRTGWGSRFPSLFKLYEGAVSPRDAQSAVVELRAAKEALSRIPPTAIVWDIENRSVRPPWGDDISSTITSLGNYFVSSTGRDLFGLLEEALQAAADEGKDAVIE
jgi:Immunity protein 70